MTSLYKIISKVLSSRLKEVLQDTIAESQEAFVARRQILDVTLVASDSVEEYRMLETQALSKLTLRMHTM